MNIADQSKKILRNSFISGLLVIVPLILTFVLLKGMVQWVDDIVEPLVVRLFGHAYFFPFVGIIITLALIMIAGFLAANVLGKKDTPVVGVSASSYTAGEFCLWFDQTIRAGADSAAKEDF